MLDKKRDWFEENKKTIGIVIYSIILLIILLGYFYNRSFFIIVISVSILLISGIFPILYYVQLMKQQITSEDYYLKIIENNYTHLNENLLVH